MKNENSTLEIKQMILNSNTVVVSSLDKNGYPTSRAMLMLNEKTSLSEMYFSTNTFSYKVIQFHENSKASLYFHTTNPFRGLYLKGEINIIFDQKIKDFFWHEGDEKYYRFGKTDPNYCILKFTPVEGNYYCGLRIDRFVIFDGEIQLVKPDLNTEVPDFLKQLYKEYINKMKTQSNEK
ncbi:MAG: pyridoxamine 5'-phosphate oxidase family protein [Firmicutes bacterium]|nr:pyridoxamine 5'-phosphate oxidase family protein [Bacillota bacterium]